MNISTCAHNTQRYFSIKILFANILGINKCIIKYKQIIRRAEKPTTYRQSHKRKQ